MPVIHLTTFVAAPVDVVFDLSRSVSLLKTAMDHFDQQAVGGITSGLLNPEDTVTWKGKHFYKTRYFTSKITEMKAGESFTDKMIKGDFKSIVHRHYFKPATNGTIIINILEYETPYGWLGRLVNKFYLHSFLEMLIHHHNKIIRQYAEGEKWRALLGR